MTSAAWRRRSNGRMQRRGRWSRSSDGGLKHDAPRRMLRSARGSSRQRHRGRNLHVGVRVGTHLASGLNLPATGAMGQGSSHALGLALGLPHHRVFVLDGDGALLMNLGTLVTIANAAPKNLFHFVCENGTYEANGSHPLPNQGGIDFAGLARAAGFTHAYTFDELESFTEALPDVLALDGPCSSRSRLSRARSR